MAQRFLAVPAKGDTGMSHSPTESDISGSISGDSAAQLEPMDKRRVACVVPSGERVENNGQLRG